MLNEKSFNYKVHKSHRLSDLSLHSSSILSDCNLTPVNKVVVTPSKPIPTQLKCSDDQLDCRTV